MFAGSAIVLAHIFHSNDFRRQKREKGRERGFHPIHSF